MNVSKKLDSIEILRGVAALIVVVHHLFGLLNEQHNFGRNLLWNLSSPGHCGVDIFFVLSGFVIAFSNQKEAPSARGVSAYLLRRATRIYPLFWIAMLLLTPYYMVMAPGTRGEITWGRFVGELFLLRESGPLIIGVAWTLCFEVMFYLFFTIMILHRKAGAAFWTALSIAIVIFNVRGVSFASIFLQHLFSVYVLEFIGGMVVCHLLLKHPATGRTAKAFAWVGAMVMMVAALSEWIEGRDFRNLTLVYGLGASLLVFGLVCTGWQPSPAPGILTRWGMAAGRYSYSIYLFHMVIEQSVTRLGVKTFGQQAAIGWVWLVAITGFVAAVGGGMLIGKHIELPILRWCKSWIRTFSLRTT
jgi:exopolysaccharide production protein ExoZ